MKLKFTNNLHIQAQYTCFLAKSIEQGFYQKGNFFVLPRVEAKNRSYVYFPPLNYSSEFWELISKCENKNLSGNFPEKAVRQVEEQLSHFNFRDQKSKLKHAETYWVKKEDVFFRCCREFLLLDDVLTQTKQIQVLVTPFGTGGSYFAHPSSKETMYLTYRSDSDPDIIARTLLLAFHSITMNNFSEIGEPAWLNRFDTVKFLTRQTIFGKLFPNIPHINQKKVSKLLKDSNDYLTELGFPKGTPLQIKDKSIVICGKATDGIFTLKEKALTKYLIKNAKRVVSSEEISEAIWGESADEKFSLYAISKFIEQIRKKVKQLGVNREIIFTIRGQGYLLDQ